MLRIMSLNIWNARVCNRETLHCAVIRRYLPDTLGLQERSQRWQNEQNDLSRALAPDYAEVEVDIGGHERNFTPILYRPSTLELLDSGWHYFSGLNDVGSKTITWAVFSRRADGARFVHLNTHFYWTGDEKGNAARLTDAAEMTRLAERLAARYPYPMLCTGDYNCKLSSEPAQALLAAGFRETRLLSAGEASAIHSHHPYPAFDEAAQLYHSGPLPTGGPERAIDHIYLYGEAQIDAHVTVTDQEALDASDHCPIYVDVSLRAQA